MANPSRLRTFETPLTLDGENDTEVNSPARGAEMRNFLQARLQKNRVPSLVHSWDFYHDRQARTTPGTDETGGTKSTTGAAEESYATRLEHLASIDDVRQFWNVFNNFDVERLMLRDSVHLFHKGVKPVWEDERNARGGCWTFRISKTHAADAWRDVCLLAIGEQLQAAAEDPERTTFRDDICGVSISVRFNSMLVQVWNRDAEHERGIEAIKDTVIDGIAEEARPRDGNFYYKKHSEHAGFGASS